MSSQSDAVYELFVAFGQQRNSEQINLFTEELRRSKACEDCAIDVCRLLMRKAKRLPSLMLVLTEVLEHQTSDAHLPHISLGQLAPRSESFWRHEAVKVILPKVKGDHDLAAYVAAAMWWSGLVEPDLNVIAEECDTGPWIAGARTYCDGKNVAAIAQAAFLRAEWATEHHPSEPMPDRLVQLELPAPTLDEVQG